MKKMEAKVKMEKNRTRWRDNPDPSKLTPEVKKMKKGRERTKRKREHSPYE